MQTRPLAGFCIGDWRIRTNGFTAIPPIARRYSATVRQTATSETIGIERRPRASNCSNIGGHVARYGLT
jgi:hypothetical protein